MAAQTFEVFGQYHVRLVVQYIDKMIRKRVGIVIEQSLHILARRNGRRFSAGKRGKEVAIEFSIATVGDGLLERMRCLVEALHVLQDASAMAPSRRQIRIDSQRLIIGS